MLEVETVLSGEKRLAAARGTGLGVGFEGFEMHMGVTAGVDAGRPLLVHADGRGDGAVSADGLVAGTYVHGLFQHDGQRAAWLRLLGAAPSGHRHAAAVEAALDGLAAHLEAHMDVGRLFSLAR